MATLSAAVFLLLCVLSAACPVVAVRQASLKGELANQLSISELNLALQAWFTGNVPRARDLVGFHRARTARFDDSAHTFPWGLLETAIREAEGGAVWNDSADPKDIEISPDDKTLAIAPFDSNVVLLDLASSGWISSPSDWQSRQMEFWLVVQKTASSAFGIWKAVNSLRTYGK